MRHYDDEYEEDYGGEEREYEHVAPRRQSRQQEPPRSRRSRRRHRGRGFRWFVFLLIIAGLIWFVRGSRPGTAGDGRGEGRATVLLVGTDKGGTLTDTIMLLSLDKTGNTLRLLSIPRDTYVDASYSPPKINSACGAAGGGKAGMLELTRQVSNLLGFRPDGYVAVDINAFVQIVDLMGGVDFNVPMDMDYDDPDQDLHIHLSAGAQHLDGSEAIQLVRFRSGYPMADLTRTSVQRDFVQAAMTQWKNVKNIALLPGLVPILREKVTTDLSLRNLFWIGTALLRCDPSAMTTDILPGEATYIGDGSYYVADAAGVSALMAEGYSPYR